MAAIKNFFKSVRQTLWFWLAVVDLIALDQLTKFAVIKNIPWELDKPTYHFGGENEPICVIDNFFYIVHIANEGAAWGILAGRTYLLSSIAILVVLAIWFFRKSLGFASVWVQIFMGIFVGGVLGNLFDRIYYGHVIDFIDIHLPLINYRWPAFNIADCGITVGVILYMIYSFIDDARNKSKIPDKHSLKPPKSI